MKTAILFTSLLFGGSILFEKPEKGIPEKKSRTIHATTRLKKDPLNLTMPKAPVSIIVDKSSYELYVYDAEGWYATYPVVFGNSSLDDKKIEGDRNTPEGTFRIVNKRIHDKWDRYMGLDYPTKETLARFNQRKRNGEIPASASPGGGIGIH